MARSVTTVEVSRRALVGRLERSLRREGRKLATDRRGQTVRHIVIDVEKQVITDSNVILINLGADQVTIERGAPIVQLVFAPTVRASIHEVASLDDTTRGVRGFGSTGTGQEGH